jgi:hypothetical protein
LQLEFLDGNKKKLTFCSNFREGFCTQTHFSQVEYEAKEKNFPHFDDPPGRVGKK